MRNTNAVITLLVWHLSMKPFPTEIKMYFPGYSEFVFSSFFFSLERQKEMMIHKFKKHKYGMTFKSQLAVDFGRSVN